MKWKRYKLAFPAIVVTAAMLFSLAVAFAGTSGESWSVDITASEGAGTVTIGMAGSHSEEIWSPSWPPAYYLENDGKEYSSFIVEYADDYTWTSTLSTTEAYDFTFTWDNLDTAGVPEDYEVTMQVKGSTVNLRNQTSCGPITIETNTQITITAENLAANVAPTADFSFTPSAPTTQDTVQFTDGSTDSDGTIASWSWDFGDGSTSTAENPTHSYADDGTYTVALTVTDDDGATDSYSADVSVSNVAPTADFSVSPTSPKAGEPVTFDASTSSDSDGDIASYEWSFGDETTATGQSVTHTYSEGDTYTVSLTVTDDDGATDTSSQGVEVEAAPTAEEWTVNLKATAIDNGTGDVYDTDNIRIGMSQTPDNGNFDVGDTLFSWSIDTGPTFVDYLIVENQDSYTWETYVDLSSVIYDFEGDYARLDFEWDNLSEAGVQENRELTFQHGSETVDMWEQTSYGPVYSDYAEDIEIIAGKVEEEEEDTTPPTISLDAVTSPTAESTQTITGTVTDDVSAYGEITVTVEGSSVPLESDNTFSATVSLTEGTNTIDVEATDNAGNTATATATIELDTTAPTISGVTVAPTATGATVSWTTDEPATTEVECDGATSVDETLTTSHSVTLSGLDPGTTYSYEIKSLDEVGNYDTYSGSFTTEEAAVEDVVDYYNGADDQLSVDEVVDAVDDFIEGEYIDELGRQLTRSDIETLVDQLYDDLTG